MRDIRLRHRRGLVAVLVLLVATLSAAVAATPAEASGVLNPTALRVSASNANFTSTCTMHVDSVNPNTAEAQVEMGATATPKGRPLNNAFTEVFCSLYDSSSDFLSAATWSVNGGYLVFQPTHRFTEPYSPFYVLCVTGYVKLRNGADSGPISNCT